MLDFKKVDLTIELINELMPLLKQHYDEIAVYKDIEMSVRTDLYLQLAANNMIKAFIAVHDEKGIIGYSIYITGPNLHYSNLRDAKNDVIYIDKNHRGFGATFIKWCDEQLKEDGIQLVTHHIKPNHDWSHLIQRQGYVKFETIYAKRLDKE